jgi:DHA1 family inner membrane transport protein
MPLPLIALFLAAFAFGTTEFVIAGVLPDVAEGLGVSVPTAGYLVSGYALGIAVGGPLLTMLTPNVARRTLLLCLTLVFTLGQVACALAPGFASMLALRVAVAAAHGTYFGVAMVVATSLVRAEQRGMAVALVLAGLTVSGIVGVPAGTAIGNVWGWRATFWAMTVLGVLAAAAIALLIPAARTVSAPHAGLRREIGVLGRQQVWTSLIVMLMLMMGQFVPYTYITPLLEEITGLGVNLVPWVLLASGIGATAGVFAGGKLAGQRLMPSLIALLAVQAIVLATMYAAGPYPLPMVAVTVLWSGVNFAIGTAVQTRILAWTADAPNLASSLIPSGFNVGIAVAAFVGATMLNAGLSYRSLPLVGVAAMAVAVTAACLSHAAERRGGDRPPVPAAG